MLFKPRKKRNINQKKITVWTSAVLLTVLSSTGCGILGKKQKPDGNTNIAAAGCLDNSKDLVNRFITGQMTQSQWKASFDCINQSLGFFQEYVRGSTPGGYTQSDMYSMVKQFLLTNKQFTPGLMTAAFDLKRALFGGDDQSLSLDQVELLKAALIHLRDITSELIPYLQLRQQANPDLNQIVGMVNAFQTAGEQLSDYIHTLPTGSLTSSTVESLITELTNSLGLPVFDDLSGKIFLTKWLIFNTRRDEMENTDWADFFKTALGVGGIYIAYQTAVGTDPTAPQGMVSSRLKNDYHFREFVWHLASLLKPYLENSIAKHNGFIPFPIFDHIVDEIPTSLLGDIPASDLKQALRPMIRKIFFSSSQMGIDQKTVDTAYGLLGDVVKNLGLADRMYERIGIDQQSVTPAVMHNALDAYESTLTDPNDKVHFTTVKNTIFNYQPTMVRDQNTGKTYAMYEKNLGYSKDQVFITLALQRLVEHLQLAYGTGNGFFQSADFHNFFEDYLYQTSHILFSLKMVDPTSVHFGEKRFSDINLFTPVSKGDAQVTVQEIVYYAMMIISSSETGSQMRAAITPICDLGQGVDILGWEYLSPACWRNQLLQTMPNYLGNFPHFQAYWNSISNTDRIQAIKWLEHGSRRGGYSNDNPVGSYDLGAFATAMYYTESLFTRFDGDWNSTLNKNEVNSAYPVFKTLIEGFAPIAGGNDFILKGAFTYIVKYRAMPDTSGNLQGLAKLGFWLIEYSLPGTQYSTDRMGVYNIMCLISSPEIPQGTDSKTIMAFNAQMCATQ